MHRATRTASVREPRAIGPGGTAARLCLGIVLVAWPFFAAESGELATHELALGLLGLPLVALLAIGGFSRASGDPLRATGPTGYVVNFAIAGALLSLPFTRNAAFLFYGASMLLAAARGYAGCEVLAVPNWLLRREDELACPVFSPLDNLEAATAGSAGE